MADAPKKERRTPAVVLGELEELLASMDGISNRDRFTLGRLVHEYGNACAGETGANILGGMLEAIVKPGGPLDPRPKGPGDAFPPGWGPGAPR